MAKIDSFLIDYMELILVASEYPFGIFKLIAGGDRH
jgi:hypothetical protein